MTPYFSIVMPTYNSAATLETVLDALRNQTIDQSELELLVIDGGSTDNTRVIAKRYGATVIENPQRLPEYAKSIGLQHASGKFIVRLDSDEELLYQDQLLKRKELLEANPDVQALLADRLVTPQHAGIATHYVNTLGDPFTYFCYRSKGSVRTTFAHNIIVGENGAVSSILRFKPDDIKPIGDGGSTTLSMDFIRQNFSDRLGDISFACSAFDAIVQLTQCCACIEGDNILHHSSASFHQYLKKLDFRIVNNLFHKEESGFSSREGSNPLLAKRKKLFVAYAGFILPVVFDAIRLAVVHKDPSFMLHVVYVYYIGLKTALYLIRSRLGHTASAHESYGQ